MMAPLRPELGCPGYRRAWRGTRREILRVGFLSGLGLTIPTLLQAADQAPSRKARARSVIMIYLHGGHAQQETWDPKPDGPLPERGQFGAIATSVPGVRISELLPLSAQLMNRLTVLRSVSHDNANHVQASLSAMTGHSHPPGTESRGDFPPTPTDFPPFGAVVQSLLPERNLPTWVQVGPLMRRNNGTVLHGQTPGFLGPRHAPLVVNQDLLPPDVRVEAVTPESEVPALRLAARRDLLQQIEAQRRVLDRTGAMEQLDSYQRRALNLLTSTATARAFQLAEEKPSQREAYGRTQFGQSCILARRLAEAGVPLISVHYCHTPAGSWDTHGKHFEQMKQTLCPTFDQGFTALIRDLEDRGLLDQTLVFVNAEFGRTPRINSNAGRDHWPWVYSLAFAGGGMRPGAVLGASDRIAARPITQSYSPADVAATVYHLLGVPPETLLRDQVQRPHTLVIGRKIDGLLA